MTSNNSGGLKPRKNGDKQVFSRRDKAMKVQCRLYYFWILKRLLNISKQCVLLFAPNTDRLAVVMHVNSEDQDSGKRQ